MTSEKTLAACGPATLTLPRSDKRYDWFLIAKHVTVPRHKPFVTLKRNRRFNSVMSWEDVRAF